MAIFQESMNISFCKNTFRNFIKKLGYSYKRFRFIPAKKPDEKLYLYKKDTLEKYERLANKGKIDLYFFDESGFSNVSNIPYGWSPIGEILTINSSYSKRFNVLGFLNKNGQVFYNIEEGRVDSEKVIKIFDSFSQTLTKPTVVVLDNASIHTSNKFKQNISKWLNRGLTLFYLPPYSPQLNVIEILWKFIKYYWINIEAFKSYENMKNYVVDILNKFKNGNKNITFNSCKNILNNQTKLLANISNIKTRV